MFGWIKGLYWNIERVIQWIPVIWNDREFDGAFFLRMIAFKLERMEKFFSSEYAICESSEKCAEEIHICRLLCDRLIADEYYEMLGRKTRMYCDNKGHIQFETLEEGCRLGICKKWTDYEDYMQKQDLKYLGKLLKKHLRGWWD